LFFAKLFLWEYIFCQIVTGGFMNLSAEKVVSEALALPRLSRAFVAEKLIESLDVQKGDDTISPKWKKEIRRRCMEIDKNSVKLHEAEEVFEKAFSAIS
jgi:hypothetical protein